MATKTHASTYQIKVTLADSKPPIWRRLLVPSTITLAKLHDILQIAMGWDDYHLHQFIARDQYYGVPNPEYDDEMKNEARVKLSGVLQQEKDTMVYEYDFGDGWNHKIVLEKVLPHDPNISLPRCTAGKRACPPEDCGGVWGYADFLEIIGDPNHPEHKEMLDWVGGEFDPEHFDIAEVNRHFE